MADNNLDTLFLLLHKRHDFQSKMLAMGFVILVSGIAATVLKLHEVAARKPDIVEPIVNLGELKPDFDRLQAAIAFAAGNNAKLVNEHTDKDTQALMDRLAGLDNALAEANAKLNRLASFHRKARKRRITYVQLPYKRPHVPRSKCPAGYLESKESVCTNEGSGARIMY